MCNQKSANISVLPIVGKTGRRRLCYFSSLFPTTVLPRGNWYCGSRAVKSNLPPRDLLRILTFENRLGSKYPNNFKKYKTYNKGPGLAKKNFSCLISLNACLVSIPILESGWLFCRNLRVSVSKPNQDYKKIFSLDACGPKLLENKCRAFYLVSKKLRCRDDYLAAMC